MGLKQVQVTDNGVKYFGFGCAPDLHAISAYRADNEVRYFYRIGNYSNIYLAFLNPFLDFSGKVMSKFYLEFRGFDFEIGQCFRDAVLGHSSVAADGYHQMELLGNKMERSVATPEQALYKLARDYLRFAAENPNLYRLMFSAEVVAYRNNPEFERASDSSFGRLTNWWYGQGYFDPKKSAVEYPYALGVWSIMHGAAMQMIDGLVAVDTNKNAAINKLADTIMGVLIEGVSGALPKNT